MRSLLGISNPMRFLFGMGAMMRTGHASPSARSSESPATLFTRVPSSGMSSKVLTVGPVWMSATVPTTPYVARTRVSWLARS